MSARIFLKVPHQLKHHLTYIVFHCKILNVSYISVRKIT